MKLIRKNTLQICGINLQLSKGGMSMNLKQLRKESGIKAYKVAEKLDISRVQFNNIENGIYNLDMLKIERLSEIYGKSIEEIEMACEVTKDERRRNIV
jgi:putative transcriptional regulator